jgi:hypothetical protein
MFIFRHQLARTISAVAALVLRLRSWGLVPSAADTGTGYTGHLVKVSPHQALAKPLNTAMTGPSETMRDVNCRMPNGLFGLILRIQKR